MRLFFDTNVWISAFAAKGLCRDLVRLALALHAGTRVTLVTSRCVAAETARILGDKFNLHGESVDAALLALGAVEGMPILDPRAAYLRLRGLG